MARGGCSTTHVLRFPLRREHTAIAQSTEGRRYSTTHYLTTPTNRQNEIPNPHPPPPHPPSSNPHPRNRCPRTRKPRRRLRRKYRHQSTPPNQSNPIQNNPPQSNPTKLTHLTTNSGANPPASPASPTSSARSKCTAARATNGTASWCPAPPPTTSSNWATLASQSRGGATRRSGCLGTSASSSFMTCVRLALIAGRTVGRMGGISARGGLLRIRSKRLQSPQYRFLVRKSNRRAFFEPQHYYFQSLPFVLLVSASNPPWKLMRRL
jgi:hypothetical protein